MVDGFAAEAPVGTDPESGQRAVSEQPVDGRRMHSQVLGELADSHDFALRRLFQLLVGCQNRIPFADLPQRILGINTIASAQHDQA